MPKTLSPLPLASPALWRSSPVSLPSSPGVYWFLDPDGQVIYVGKAKNLKHRLTSYCHVAKLLPKTLQLVTRTKSVKYQILNSELEALLIEAELIRLHQPHYNILLKDDKSPLYIVTTQETYPRVLTLRKSDLTTGEVAIKRIFGPFPSGRQVRQVLAISRRLFPFCNATEFAKKRHQACFYSHLGLCPGACTGTISSADYKQIIHRLELFIQGKHAQVVKSLTKSIDQAALKHEYELAGELKSKIHAIQYVIHHSHRSTDEPLPNLTDDLEQQRDIELIRLLDSQGVRLPQLHRIEAYDVANLQGQSPTVSMVVAVHGRIDHHEYKHFTVRSLSTPNDPAMLKEVLIRRQRHPEWGMPDVILLDGGRTQLNAVAKILDWQVALVGLAKHPDRLLIVLSKNPLRINEVRLDPGHPAGSLLIALRDEAHRFARRLHHRHSDRRLLNLDKANVIK